MRYSRRANPGLLVAKATTCYTLLAGEEKTKALVTPSRKYSTEQIRRFANDLLLAAHAPFDAATTPLGQLAALRKRIAQVVVHAEEMNGAVHDGLHLPHIERRLRVMRVRMQQLDALIRHKQTVAPIPLVTCNFADVKRATVAALATPHDLPHELELLTVLRGMAHQRVTPRAAARPRRRRLPPSHGGNSQRAQARVVLPVIAAGWVGHVGRVRPQDERDVGAGDGRWRWRAPARRRAHWYVGVHNRP